MLADNNWLVIFRGMRSKGRDEEPATAAAAAAQYGSIAKWMVARRNNNREERFKMENVTKCIEFMSIVPHERGVLPPHHSIPFHSILARVSASLDVIGNPPELVTFALWAAAAAMQVRRSAAAERNGTHIDIGRAELQSRAGHRIWFMERLGLKSKEELLTIRNVDLLLLRQPAPPFIKLLHCSASALVAKTMKQ